MKRIKIPETLAEILHWVKECTEKAWSESPSETSGYEEWLYGAKWLPLSDTEIDSVEQKYNIKFSPDHRTFLRILHTIDKYEPQEYQDKKGETQRYYRPYFYNWLKDTKELERYLSWPFVEILVDIEGVNNVWVRDAWGKRPETTKERKQVFSAWYAKAPCLLPLTSHQFLVNDDTLRDRPVLSVWGSDIIVWEWEFKMYFLEEYSQYLGLLRKNYKPRSAWLRLRKEEIAKRPQRTIPYWEEIIEGVFMENDIL